MDATDQLEAEMAKAAHDELIETAASLLRMGAPAGRFAVARSMLQLGHYDYRPDDLAEDVFASDYADWLRFLEALSDVVEQAEHVEYHAYGKNGEGTTRTDTGALARKLQDVGDIYESIRIP